MIERTHRFGLLVFDRGAIVRAALRAYVETILAWVDPLKRHNFPASFAADWAGDLRRGALCNRDGSGAYDVVAWTEAGVVGFAYELGFGPLEQLDLSAHAVTGGPDDVRGAVADLPPELEPTLELAAGMLDVGAVHGEKLAGVGFWLQGDRVGGTLFDDPMADGARQLAAWGLLQDGRLPLLCDPGTAAIAAALARTTAAPIHTVVDAVVARALAGPTELTADEIETLLPSAPDPKRLLGAQRRLRKVGITWPGSPEIPEEPQPTGANPFLPRP